MPFFSPETVNDLIPELEKMTRVLREKRRELAIRLLEQDPELRAAAGKTGTPLGERRSETRRCTELKADVVRIVNRIEAYGCVVKDIDLGLLDFPALRDGRTVYLCWKSGEPRVAHWHGIEERFADRKAL